MFFPGSFCTQTTNKSFPRSVNNKKQCLNKWTCWAERRIHLNVLNVNHILWVSSWYFLVLHLTLLWLSSIFYSGVVRQSQCGRKLIQSPNCCDNNNEKSESFRHFNLGVFWKLSDSFWEVHDRTFLYISRRSDFWYFTKCAGQHNLKLTLPLCFLYRLLCFPLSNAHTDTLTVENNLPYTTGCSRGLVYMQTKVICNLHSCDISSISRRS